MRIEKIHIQNYKSLVDFTLENVKPFTAFVGPNASGKSNIFEALEFCNYCYRIGNEAYNLFGSKEHLFSFNPFIFENNNTHKETSIIVNFSNLVSLSYFILYSKKNDEEPTILDLLEYPDKISSNKESTEVEFISRIKDKKVRLKLIDDLTKLNFKYSNHFEIILDNFSRIFVGKEEIDRIPATNKLTSSGKNLAQIIAKIFEDPTKREDFIEWLRVLVPAFKDIVVKQSNIDGSFAFEVIEKNSNKPFPIRLLSDGTRNILTLMAAVYQQEQQFLCIEEPENGLHPQAIELLVGFFREKCQGENGHHIWLNTHSPTLIRCLEIDEVITVNKIDGRTIAKQNNGAENINIKTDEAWLSNALGGGVSWSK
jgi:AAA15 family ATPase/GTPase